MKTRSAQHSILHQPPPDLSFTEICRGLAGLLLALGLVLGGPLQASPVSAQSMSPDSTEEADASQWHANVDEQIARGLEQDPSNRVSYIQVVIETAVESERVDLSETAWALLDVIEADSNPAHRLMAVQALHKIGRAHVGEKQYQRVMRQLHDTMQGEPSEQVRISAAETLARYTES